jgi:hypothetical protein
VDFWNSLKVLARRWYIVAVGLLVTLGGAVGVNSLIAPSYTAAGSLVLAVPPNLPERAASANPYLAYGNLSVAARVVASAMNQPSVVRDQREKGATGDFVVDLDPERSSPIITVNSTAGSAAGAIKTVEVVTAGVKQLLADRQKDLGAPQNTWITASSVVVPEEANQAIGSRLRAVSAVLVLGFIGTLTLAFAVEGMAQGRSRQTAGVGGRLLEVTPTPAPQPAPPPPPEPAPAGICPLCHRPFRAAADLAWHLEDAHGLRNGETVEAPRPAPAVPAPAPPRTVRPSARRPLSDAAAAANPPARRPRPPATPAPPAAPAPRTTRTRKSAPPSP